MNKNCVKLIVSLILMGIGLSFTFHPLDYVMCFVGGLLFGSWYFSVTK